MKFPSASLRVFLSSDWSYLFLIAILIRILAALPQQQPNYMDAAYSYVNALNLANGRGFVEDFVWNYLSDPPPPPHPSHLYWMPLTSILAWLGMMVGGLSYRAAQVPFIILSALLAPITYWAAYALSVQRWQRWLAGLFMIFSGFYFPFWTAIDNFTPFAVAGSLALIMAWLAITSGDRRPSTADRRRTNSSQLPFTNCPSSHLPRSSAPLLLCAGFCAGLAHLARADGPLFLIAIILTYFLYLIRSLPARSHAATGRQASRITHYASRITCHVSRITFYLLLGYMLVMAPWFIRNWQVTGALLPAAGSQTIWLTSYDDLFSYGQILSPQTFFAQGMNRVLQGRWWAFTTNLVRVVAEWGMIFLPPLVLVGGWHLRRHLLIQLASLYALILFAAMTILFAFPGARGGIWHSGAALLPFIYATAVAGLDRVIDLAAARRQHWDAQLAKRVFGAGLLIFAIAMSSFIYYRRVLKNNTWNSADSRYPAIATWVNENDSDAIVMINNPPAYRYHGGGLSLVVPNESLEVMLQAAHQYQVDYLVLESNHPVPLAGLYDQEITDPNLILVETLAEGSGNEVYIYEILHP